MALQTNQRAKAIIFSVLIGETLGSKSIWDTCIYTFVDLMRFNKPGFLDPLHEMNGTSSSIFLLVWNLRLFESSVSR